METRKSPVEFPKINGTCFEVILPFILFIRMNGGEEECM
jgi:hypothetical protein